MTDRDRTDCSPTDRLTDHHGHPDWSNDDTVPAGLNPVGIPQGDDPGGELPDFVRALLIITDADILARADRPDQGFTVPTWYLHHRLCRMCDAPRNVHITGEPFTWASQIQWLWQDHSGPHSTD